MASGYVKIYGSILGSSVWAEAPATRIVWITMLALADADGHVEASVGGLARFANVTVKQCEAALLVLSSPDPDSKSPDHEGRRIEKVDRGWTILNYRAYREMQSPKQAADAARAQEYRERKAAEREAERLAAAQRDASQTSQRVAPTVNVDEAVPVVKSTSPSAGRWNPIQEAEWADRLTTDAGRVALAGILHVARIKSAVIAELNACLSGERGPTHACTLAQLDVALSDYFAGGMSNGGTWNPNHFRACIRTAMKVPAPDIQPGRTRTQRSPDDEAAVAVTAIRGMIEANGQSRFIRRASVEAMGQKVLAAYLSIGGADRFLNVPAEKLPFLVRDFATALRTTHAA
jgi:hypothetical protein